MPKWEVDDTPTSGEIFIPVVVGIVSYIILGVTLFATFQTPSLAGYVLSFVTLAISIYLTGRIYAIFNIDKDFIEITKQGIKFRTTPPFGFGWLPKRMIINFDAIESVDLVEVSSFYNPNQKNAAILVSTKKDKFIIGNHLDNDTLTKVGLALQGSVTMSQAMKQFLGAESASDAINQVFSAAKNIWNTINKDENEKR